MDLDHEKRLADVENRSKSNTHRLDEVERRQDSLDKLVTSVEVLATRQETVESDVKEIKGDVKALAVKPAKRWDSLVDKSIWLVAGAFLAWILAGMPG